MDDAVVHSITMELRRLLPVDHWPEAVWWEWENPQALGWQWGTLWIDMNPTIRMSADECQWPLEAITRYILEPFVARRDYGRQYPGPDARYVQRLRDLVRVVRDMSDKSCYLLRAQRDELTLVYEYAPGKAVRSMPIFFTEAYLFSAPVEELGEELIRPLLEQVQALAVQVEVQ